MGSSAISRYAVSSVKVKLSTRKFGSSPHVTATDTFIRLPRCEAAGNHVPSI